MYGVFRTAVLISIPTWQATQMSIRQTARTAACDVADDDLTQDAFATLCAGTSF